MSNDISFSTFPSSKTQALTMLYLQKADISDLTPSQLAKKYDEVYEEISSHYKQVGNAKREAFYGR
ncbi:hypothetical protein [Lachnoclostridium phytofermentans]|uniref:hypothetical protein n=1 Tax=Lachnoclostridium phytofermentans TaxID=66219 RepID=UPI00055717CF|nr:hypothetical protein [Lachnoclostridium phytofermentans]